MAENSAVRLSPVLPEHMDGIFAQHSHPEGVRMAAFVYGDPFDRHEFDERMKRLLDDRTIMYRTILVDDEPVGAVASFILEDKREVTFGLHPDYWDQGFTTEALKLFLDEDQRRPLNARAASDNRASLRVLEKCGFRKVGTEVNFAPARLESIEETLLELES